MQLYNGTYRRGSKASDRKGRLTSMLNTVIIADDLTGANDTGAILAQNGFSVGTVLKLEQMRDFESYNVLCVSTNSRGMSQSNAYEIVKETANYFPKDDSILYSKRIDSTLRGNVGAEIDSILDYLGEDYHAVVVASFPDSGRTSVGDILLVHGVPLQKTEVAKDPTSPVDTSRVTEIIKKQTKHSVGYIGLEKVTKSSSYLLEELTKELEQHKIVAVDAQNNRDIEAIAACCSACGMKIVAIDPGPFTAALANQIFKRKKTENEKKILCGIGSASDLTRQQLKYLRETGGPFIVKIDTSKFFEEQSRRKEMQRVEEQIIRGAEDYRVLVITTTMEKGDVLDLSKVKGAEMLSKKECATVITSTMAEVLESLLHQLQTRIGGIYASGGDVAAAFCERLGISGFHVKGEVIPLAIYSQTVGGYAEGLPIITKGGLVGTEDTLVQCLDYLDTVIEG